MASAPCGITVDWPATSCADTAAASPADRDAAAALAINLLWRLTGRVFGLCTETVRPCFAPPGPRSTYGDTAALHGSWWPGLITGTRTTGGCGCSAGCTCVAPSEVALPGPVHAITSVWIDGQPLPDTAYRVRDRRWLIRTDGDPWPQHQDLTAPDHGTGAWTVTYQRGIPLPADGQVAVNDLACDLLRARTGGGRCSIPQRAQQIARQGVDIQLVDPTVLYEHGMTGIETVDRFLASVNPARLQRSGRVYSVDAPRTARLTP